MSMYICNECGKLKDSDFDVCVEDPRNTRELICEDCDCRLYDEDGKPIDRQKAETADLDHQDRMENEGVRQCHEENS